MIRIPFSNHRASPIGVDLGSRCVKLLQLDAQRKGIVEAVRWDLPTEADTEPDARHEKWAEALKIARQGRRFVGRQAVLCLGSADLSIQNIRIQKVPREEMQRLVYQEAAGRLPYAIQDAQIRYVHAADVRQGEGLRTELIVFACHKEKLRRRLEILEEAGLKPIGVDLEPAALLRCYLNQFRREEDQRIRTMFVHVGGSQTGIVVAEGNNVLFVKYLPVGGHQMDQAVADRLQLELSAASALRRHNGDRRADQQDPDVARGIAESVRPVIDQLVSEMAMCIRYNSVTFRGQSLARLILGGGEATAAMAEAFSEQFNLRCELGDPLRSYETKSLAGRKSQWDVATGLALREVES